MGYTPLDQDVVYSTVFRRGPMVFAVWCAVLASSNEDGMTALTPESLELLWDHKVAMRHIKEAWEILSSPEEKSRNPEHGGRRIIPTPDGRWFVVSHEKYREKFRKEVRRMQVSDAKRRQRARDEGRQCSVCEETEGLGKPDKDGRVRCAAHSKPKES